MSDRRNESSFPYVSVFAIIRERKADCNPMTNLNEIFVIEDVTGERDKSD